MAKITQYQQGQFANSVIGTPDESLQHSAAMSSANLSNDIGSTLVSTGQQQLGQYQQEQYKKQQQLDAMNKHITDLQQQATNINIVSGAETGMQQDWENIKNKNPNSPEQAAADFSKLSAERNENTLNQYSQNPEQAAELNKMLAEKRASFVQKSNEYVQSQQVPIAERQLAASDGNFITTAGAMGKNATIIPGMSSPFDDFKATMEAHTQQTARLHQQLGAKGIEGVQSTNDKAGMEYLKGIALQGNPELLQAGIKAMSDGNYMSNKSLVSVQGEALAMAAHQATINNQLQSAGQQHTLLQTWQQLTAPEGGGNGDFRNNTPGYNQKILQRAASGLKPEHLIELTKQINESGSKYNSDSARANIEDYITKNSPNGDASKATPETIHTALDKFGQNLTPSEKSEYSLDYTKSGLRQTYVKQSQTIDENIGQQMKGVNALESQIARQVKVVSGLTNNAPAHAKALQDLESMTMRYSQSVAGLSAMHQAIKDPQVKGLVDSETAYNKAKYDRMMLGFRTMADPSNPKTMADHEKLYDSLEAGVKPGTISSDPRIQQTYNYYHTRFMYDEIDKHGWKDDQIQKISKNPQAMQAFKTVIDARTQRALKGLNLIP